MRKPSDRPPAPSRQRRLLLVEDDQLVRRSLTRWLISDGFEVIAVADGQEALSVLKAAGDIACVVSDIAMPGIDGERLAALLAEQQPTIRWCCSAETARRAPTSSPLRCALFCRSPLSQTNLADALARVLQASSAPDEP